VHHWPTMPHRACRCAGGFPRPSPVIGQEPFLQYPTANKEFPLANAGGAAALILLGCFDTCKPKGCILFP
jgi:hypothetical protein